MKKKLLILLLIPIAAFSHASTDIAGFCSHFHHKGQKTAYAHGISQSFEFGNDIGLRYCGTRRVAGNIKDSYMQRVYAPILMAYNRSSLEYYIQCKDFLIIPSIGYISNHQRLEKDGFINSFWFAKYFSAGIKQKIPLDRLAICIGINYLWPIQDMLALGNTKHYRNISYNDFKNIHSFLFTSAVEYSLKKWLDLVIKYEVQAKYSFSTTNGFIESSARFKF